MFKEFPKMLYRGEDTTIVADAGSETVMRGKGWHTFGEAPRAAAEGEKPKPTRKPRAASEGDQ